MPSSAPLSVAPAADLPIQAALPELLAALQSPGRAVLVAPPGAGKTTGVPLALLEAPWRGDGIILMLEPRRIAARAAASRMASLIGEELGRTVGLLTRFDARRSAATRILVVTEGVFARMAIDDPALEGIAAVLFDEFHERSLDADFGLALALDIAGALRPDLRLLVMSATLDDQRIAGLLGKAPLIRSEGRAFPVETRWRGRDATRRIEEEVEAAIRAALASETGSLLVFLPGQGEIERVARRLAEARLPADVDLCPLYGALDPRVQDQAIRPAAPGRRKVVLATAIAETSITIDGVRVVIDSGLSRVPRHEPDLGITRLETLRVSRASADQRRGRAGRTGPGLAIRLWDKAEDAGLLPFGRPEILEADLSGFRLDCAAFGVADPSALHLLDPPPAAAWREAGKLLADLGALDQDGRITPHGKAMRALPLEPRLAALVLDGASRGAADPAALIAALVSERGIGGTSTDLADRLERLRRDGSQRARQLAGMAARWAAAARSAAGAPGAGADISTGGLVALAFPDRIAERRGEGLFLLANGRQAALDAADPLARAPMIAVADLTGSAQRARITLAAALDRAEFEALFADRIESEDRTVFDRSAGALRRRKLRRYRALTLDSAALPVEASLQNAETLARGAASAGIGRLPWSKAQRQLRDRVGFLVAAGMTDLPDLADEALALNAESWLAPHLLAATSLAGIDTERLGAALDALLPYALRQRLEREAPTHFVAPTGQAHPIQYEGENAPLLSIRVQELYGLKAHPTIAGGRLRLTLELTSPAHRPIQVTRDLPGFWAGSWADVRTEMRGRYPKHPWPEDPANALPTTRAKPRGT